MPKSLLEGSGRVWGRPKSLLGSALEGHWSTQVAPRVSTTNRKPFFQQKWARPCESTSYWNLVCQPKWAKLKQINRKLKTGGILGSKIDHGRTLEGILGSKLMNKSSHKLFSFCDQIRDRFLIDLGLILRTCFNHFWITFSKHRCYGKMHHAAARAPFWRFGGSGIQSKIDPKTMLNTASIFGVDFWQILDWFWRTFQLPKPIKIDTEAFGKHEDVLGESAEIWRGLGIQGVGPKRIFVVRIFPVIPQK